MTICLARRWLGRAWLWLWLSAGTGGLRAQIQTPDPAPTPGPSRPFVLGGSVQQLDDLTPDTAVFFRAVRPDLIAGGWNIDVVVSNRSTVTFSGPFVLRFVQAEQVGDGVRGTFADGEGKAALEITRRFPAGTLLPGAVGESFTLQTGRSPAAPALKVEVYGKRPVVAEPFLVTRTLGSDGLPLAGVTVEEVGPANPVSRVSGRDGWLTLRVMPEVRGWTFQGAGQATSFRSRPAGGLTGVTELPAVRLSREGSVPDAQSLPAPLPRGWSPVAIASASADPVSLTPVTPVLPAEVLALVQWEAATTVWRVVAVRPGAGNGPVDFGVVPAGLVVAVLADAGAGAPIAVTAGGVLPDGTAVDPAAETWGATGTVTPTVRPATREAAQALGLAEVTIRSPAGPLTSGLILRGEVAEEYRLRDGSIRVLPGYTAAVTGFRRPGPGDGAVVARFPLRPVQLLPGDELVEARVRFTVQTPGDFAGVLLTPAGGTLALGSVELSVASGALGRTEAAGLRALDGTTRVAPGGPAGTPALAFELGYAGTAPLRLTSPAVLAPGGKFVLSRAVFDTGNHGFQPVGRFRTTSAGGLESEEPVSGQTLAGIDGGGQFLLWPVSAPQAVVAGTVRDRSGQPAVGWVVRSGPWTAFTDVTGSYRLLAPAGVGSITVQDPVTGDTGAASVTVGADLAAVTADVQGADEGPRLVRSEPAAGAAQVARVSAVTLTFSRALNPGTVVGEAVRLVKEDGTALPASLSLNLARTGVTLLPTENLPAATKLRVEVATTVTDLAGRPVEGARTVTFTTESAVLDRAAATLVIHEPEGGEAALVGGPGLADPEAPVILINETTGFTATVLSKVDGSFSNSIPAEVADRLSAVLVNRNGTRNTVPASRQLFRDGRVGLYSGGGTIAVDGPGGRVELIVGANAIKERAVFRVRPTTVDSVLASANGVAPIGARLLRGLQVTVEGEAPEDGIDVAFAVDPAEFQLAAGDLPEDGSLGLLVPEEVDGVMAYQMVDKLRYENGKVFSNTAPFKGVGGKIIGGIGGFLIDSIFNFNTTVALFGSKPVVVSGFAVEPLIPVERMAELFEIPLFQLEALLTGGFLGNLPGQSDAIDDLVQNREYFKPAAGAFVFARPLGTRNARQGRIEAGAVYATVDRKGLYALALPIKVGEATVPFASVSGYELVASHPRYDKRVVEPLDLSEIGIDFGEQPFFRRNIIFGGPLAGGATPTLDVQVALEPTAPALGQAAQLRAVAFTSQAESTLSAVVEAVVSTVAGASVSAADVRIESPHTVYLGRGRTELTATVTATKSLQAILRVRAGLVTPGGTLSNSAVVVVRFGEGEPPLPDVLQPADREDVVGPGVLRSSLAQGGVLPVGGRIVLQFSEPVNRRSVFLNGAVRFDPAPLTPPSLFLSADQTTLEIFPGLYPETVAEAQVSLTSVIRDLADRRFDQSTEPGEQSYQLKFKPAGTARRNLVDLEQGGGVVAHRGFLYALDRGPRPRLQVYRQDAVLTGDGRPVASVPLVGQPRDLLLIRDWAHKRSLHDTQVRTSDLLVVVGGDAGSSDVDKDGNVFFGGQYLRVFDLSQPAAPERILGALLTLRNSLVTRVAWHPPHLAYLESGADLQQTVLVNLQAMLVGFNSTEAEGRGFPADPLPGKDAAQDGSFVQAGDELPQPERRPLEYFGKEAGFLLEEFGLYQDIAMGRGFLAAVSTGGRDPEVPDSLPALPAFRTLRAGGVSTPPGTGVLTFGGASRPKRVTVLLDALVSISGQLQRRALALVSMAPDQDQKNKVVLVDLANPLAPSRFPDAIEIPAALGVPQSITPRDDGLLALATTTHLILLDPLRLLEPAPGGVGTAGQAERMHPAMVSFIPNAGSGNRTLDSEPTGVNVVNLGTRHEVVLSPPRMSFVIFPTNPAVANPRALIGQEAALDALMAGRRTLTGIPLARLASKGGAVSTVTPASPLTHSYVMVEAPGAAGASLTVALEALNPGGYALKDKGADFAPVRAVSTVSLQALKQAPESLGGKDGQGIDFRAPVPTLRAHRLSADPASRYYNLYLSEPFTLIREKISRSQVQALSAGRPILYSAHALRASLDLVDAGNPVVGPFASRVDSASRQLVPGAFVVAETLATSYVPGDNPPPRGAEIAFPGTFGMVNALNGEVRRTEVDVQLPGRRMPIVFQRTLAGQDLQDGPFGPGWDHWHNQHLVEFKASLFPPGSQAPLVVRNAPERSSITESRDVQFVDGEGHVVLFRHRGQTAPEGVQGDPLCQELGWFDSGGTFYTPDVNSKLVFDLLYRFPAGEFCRLTPAGQQFWYAADGRLLRIKHRHTRNQQVLGYTARGELERIVDLSVEPPRMLRVGYYRFDVDRQSELDEATDSAFVAGQICCLVDGAGRVTSYEYAPTGVLVVVRRPETDSRAQTDQGSVGFKGRPTTRYLMAGPSPATFRGVTEGNGANEAGAANSGTALFAATLGTSGGKAVATGGTGAGGVVGVAVPDDNSAETGADQAGGEGKRADDSKTRYAFNAFGQPASVSRTGTGADEANTGMTHYDEPELRGLTKTITGHEGDTVTFEYFNGSLIRSKPNIKRVIRTPGTRGGPTITRRFESYDQRFHQLTGTVVNENGKTLTYALTSDGREIQSVNYGDGAIHRREFNEFGQQTFESTPDGMTKTWTYQSGSGFLETSAVGPVTTRYQYAGTLAEALGVPSTIVLPRGQSLTMEYDARLRPVRQARGLQEVRMGYDENGNVVYTGATVAAGVKREEIRAYNQVNFLTRVTQRAVESGSGAGQDLVTTYTPDPVFRVQTVTLPAGTVLPPQLRPWPWRH